jgi:hypothetical protein
VVDAVALRKHQLEVQTLAADAVPTCGHHGCHRSSSDPGAAPGLAVVATGGAGGRARRADGQRFHRSRTMNPSAPGTSSTRLCTKASVPLARTDRRARCASIARG